ASAAPPPPSSEDSLAAVAGVTTGGSRRWLLLLGACVLLGLIGAAAVRVKGMRDLRASAAVIPTLTPSARTPSPADPSPPPVGGTGVEPPTFSVQSLPAATDTAAPLQVDQLPRASKTPPATPAPPRPHAGPAAAPPSNEGSSTPEPAPSAGPPSCDPPYWFDSNGDKRYYRRCVGH
ncbi:MAG: hypothetical protein ACRENE_01700, partial [Polyangiaceae bacterium]